MANEENEGASAEKPVAKFVAGRARQKVIPLEWPMEFGGVVYNEVTVRRCTGLEVSEYVMALASGEDVTFPGIEFPIEVYNALDSDDFDKVDEAVKDFLPQSFRRMAEQAPEASDNTSIKSDTPSVDPEKK